MDILIEHYDYDYEWTAVSERWKFISKSSDVKIYIFICSSIFVESSLTLESLNLFALQFLQNISIHFYKPVIKIIVYLKQIWICWKFARVNLEGGFNGSIWKEVISSIGVSKEG